jgi:hypothetical protein
MEFVKAATVYKLANYVAINGREENIVLCHNGGKEFVRGLEFLNRKSTIVVNINTTKYDYNKCDIYYLEPTKITELIKTLKKLNGKAIASVSELQGFVTRYGGMVRLVESEGDFILSIDVKKATDLGIFFDSRLVESASKSY